MWAGSVDYAPVNECPNLNPMHSDGGKQIFYAVNFYLWTQNQITVSISRVSVSRVSVSKVRVSVRFRLPQY